MKNTPRAITKEAVEYALDKARDTLGTEHIRCEFTPPYDFVIEAKDGLTALRAQWFIVGWLDRWVNEKTGATDKVTPA